MPDADRDPQRERSYPLQSQPQSPLLLPGMGSLAPAFSPLFDDLWYTHLPSTDHIQFFTSTNWAASLLGPLETWDLALRLHTFTVLSDSHSCCLYWGPEKVAIYNESFAPLAGKAHPELMGQTFQEGFPEIWPQILPLFDLAEQQGMASDVYETLLFVERNNVKEETYFTGNFNPVRGLSGKVEGFHNATHEVTEQIIGNRRTKMLNSMEVSTGVADKDLASYVMESLKLNPKDITMALLYEVDDETVSESTIVHLRDSIGVPVGHPIAVEIADLDSPDGIIDLLRKARKEIHTVPVDDRFAGVQWGFKEDDTSDERISSDHVSVLPLVGGGKTIGFLVVGVNPRRPVDKVHLQFMKDIASKVSSIAGSVITAEEAKKRNERLEKKLSDSDKEIRNMALNASVGMLRLSVDGKITWANEQYSTLTGSRPIEEGERFHFLEVFLDEDRERALETWQKVLRSETIDTQVSVQLRLRKQFKSPIGEEEPGYVQSTLRPIFENGKVIAVTIYMTDISAQKWAERTEARKALHAREAKKRQEEFIDVVSHEMRNPLSAITMSADAISKSLAEVKTFGITEDRLLSALEANVDSANIIITCASHQKRIVDDVLTLSKLEYMMLSIKPKPVELQTVINSTLNIFESELRENNIEATTNGDQSITLHSADMVSCDSDRVIQILANFFTNAIKFTKTEEKRRITLSYGTVTSDPKKAFPQDIMWAPIDSAPTTPELMIREPSPGPTLYLTFEVEDSGVGMKSEEMHKLFGRFAQANIKTSIKYEGSGLGLFISKKLAEKMGGAIGVMSQPGKGSTFAFYVEAHQVTADAVEIHAAEPAEFPFPPLRSISDPVVIEPSMVIDVDHIHVLVVEDNLINQRVTVGQLQKAGCTVTIANHGEEALERLKGTRLWRGNLDGQKLDIILMDWEMPVMDGLTCAKEIRKLEADGHLTGPHIEIIATTANAREEQRNKALESGIDSVISKPYLIDDLLKLMRERLSLSMARHVAPRTITG